MEVWELIAREAIRDLVARYNASGDSGRFDETIALFAEDATLEIVPGQLYRGRAEIRSLFTSAAERSAPATPAPESPRALLRHYTATHQIDVLDAANARGRCYYAVLTADGLDHWGRYVDAYRCIGGSWRFQSRRVTIDGSIAGGWAERTSARLTS